MSKATALSLKLAAKFRQENSGDYPSPEFSVAEAVLHAEAYEEMTSEPENTTVKQSYDSFISELVSQFRVLLDTGFECIDGKGSHHYPSSDAMREDIANGFVVYLPTYSNDGTISEIPAWHPLAGSVSIEGVGYCLNDIFRIVHDVYAHGQGHSFSPQGEHNAWLAHRELLSRESHLALWCETKAQNSWVNYGRHIRNNPVFVPASERPFAPQKCGIIPDLLI